MWERVLRSSEKMQVEGPTLLSYLTDTSRTQDVLLLIYSLSLSLHVTLTLFGSLSLLLSASLSSLFFSNFELYCKGCAANSFLFVLNFSLSLSFHAFSLFMSTSVSLLYFSFHLSFSPMLTLISSMLNISFLLFVLFLSYLFNFKSTVCSIKSFKVTSY